MTRTLGRAALDILTSLNKHGGHLEYSNSATEGEWYYLWRNNGLWYARYRPAQVSTLIARGCLVQDGARPRYWTISPTGRQTLYDAR